MIREREKEILWWSAKDMMLPRYAPQIMLMGKLPCIVMFASSVGNAFICSSEPNHGKLHNIINKHFHISYVHYMVASYVKVKCKILA